MFAHAQCLRSGYFRKGNPFWTSKFAPEWTLQLLDLVLIRETGNREIICYKYDQWVALQLFLHLLTSVYVFVRLYTRRHLLALVSYRSLTIWSDDYSTPPYKPTVQRRTQTLQTRTQTVQTMEHCVLKQTIPSTLHQEHTTSYMARYVHASYPIHS